MSFKILSGIVDSLTLKHVGLSFSITGNFQQVRCRRPNTPVLRFPYWYRKQMEEEFDQKLTGENEAFIENVLNGKYPFISKKFNLSPLKQGDIERKAWAPGLKRTGLIGIHLGTIPHWMDNGEVTRVTLIQIDNNHVINYLPPGTPDMRPYARKYRNKTKGLGNLVVGAGIGDPLKYTAEYCDLFKKSGVMPKKILTKFTIHPDAVLPLGTPLYAGHFQIGDLVDVTGKTRYRGFQGVMKRWGFKGMPRSHGQTKTHRRPGNIGAGGEKGRVWPGKKMPGHVGNKTLTARCLQVVRINHEHNVLYVRGIIPGDVNNYVYVHDTICKEKYTKVKLKVPNIPYFPTYYPAEHPDRPKEEIYHRVFDFSKPSITFEPVKETKKK